MSTESVRVATDGYDTGAVLADHGVESVPAGTSVLVSGPAMTGKEQLTLSLLAAGECPAVTVTPDRGAGRLRDRFVDAGGDADRLWVVDCSGSSGQSSMDDTEHTKYVSGPDDLTGVGIGIAKCTRSIGDSAADGLGLATLSLSTMLQYGGADRVFNFLHVVTGRISGAGYLGAATLDPTVHDAQTSNVVRSQFDGVVEVREGEAGRELRVLGLPGADREWRPY